MFPIHDTVPRRETPFVNWIIIAANALIFLLLELSLPERNLEALFYHFGVVPARYTHPDWAVWVGLPLDNYWPFFTMMFLHGGWMHLIINMWGLYLFGDNVEDRLGHTRYLIFYLLCGLAAGITHFFFNKYSTVPAIGASGAISGVMGAYLIMFPRAQVVAVIPILFIPYFITLPAVFYFGLWFFSQLFSGTLSLITPSGGGGIAWWAHIGGFVCGILLAKLCQRFRKICRYYYPDEHYAMRFLDR